MLENFGGLLNTPPHFPLQHDRFVGLYVLNPSPPPPPRPPHPFGPIIGTWITAEPVHLVCCSANSIGYKHINSMVMGCNKKFMHEQGPSSLQQLAPPAKFTSLSKVVSLLLPKKLAVMENEPNLINTH